jgi:hypothetical protein
MTKKWVYYESEIYTVVHDYGNGWSEIQKVNTLNVKLVETKYLVPVVELNKDA